MASAVRESLEGWWVFGLNASFVAIGSYRLRSTSTPLLKFRTYLVHEAPRSRFLLAYQATATVIRQAVTLSVARASKPTSR
mmetsp:Transcript_3958/g.12299  ORF Transcript_3958/g.12299 Transcript_3958/m.12299 type:complete len:81 (+) Transcript_3958:543-785(+)|eukprot:scaffold239540_cov33-Tisochrysis_lutea.AAC.2